MASRKLAHFSPGRIIVLSFCTVIALGTILLSLSMSQVTPLPLIDVLFTATSSTCVTGLFTIPISQFTPFGQGIILALIQVGGLGLITLSIFLMSLFVNFGFASQLMAGQLLELESWKDVKGLLVATMLLTLSCELLGSLAFFMVFSNYYATKQAWFIAVFHAISGFCNAGITPLQHSSLFDNPLILITTALLMFFGGLGFITWNEGIKYFRSWGTKKRFSFSLHSKIILYGTFVLVSGASVLFFIAEYHHSFAHMSIPNKLLHALYMAISCRSGGLLFIPLTTLSAASIFLIMLIAFIGTSPGSTGSGIKVTSAALLFATVKATVMGRSAVEMNGRRLPNGQVRRAITIVTLSAAWIITSAFLLLVIEKDAPLFATMFEALSAFTTLGLSFGITPTLSVVGKTIVMLNMIIGRIGTIALIVIIRSFTKKKKLESSEFSYPEERVILG